MTELESTFISLVKLGIGTSREDSIPLHTDWEALMALAVRQGLTAVVLDGIGNIQEQQKPEKNLLLQWIGDSILNYENRYSTYMTAISRLAGFYNKHNLKMMVLKGLACGIDWPKPEHRPYGDIDIWLFGKQKEADQLLVKETNIPIDNSHHHHTVFNWFGFTVENHYDFIEIHYRKNSPALESILKEKGKDDRSNVTILGETVYLPSANLHALFLTRHAIEHFASSEITLRHLLDWAFFVKAHHDDIDWAWLDSILVRFGMISLFNHINAICINELGFERNLFPSPVVDLKMNGRVLNDILSPEFDFEMPSGLISKSVYKLRRWNANGWKHSMCYNESRWSAFWSTCWNHILKPESFK